MGNISAIRPIVRDFIDAKSRQTPNPCLIHQPSDWCINALRGWFLMSGTKCALGHRGHLNAQDPGKFQSFLKRNSHVHPMDISKILKIANTSTTVPISASNTFSLINSNVLSNWLSMKRNCSVIGNG